MNRNKNKIIRYGRSGKNPRRNFCDQESQRNETEGGNEFSQFKNPEKEFLIRSDFRFQDPQSRIPKKGSFLERNDSKPNLKT